MLAAQAWQPEFNPGTPGEGEHSLYTRVTMLAHTHRELNRLNYK